MNYRIQFEKIIETISVNSETSSEEFKNKMQPMVQFIQRNVPDQLYKFRECTENNLAAFDKDEIWLSKASKFNDMHDGLLFFDKSAILEAVQRIISPKNLLSIFEELKQPDFLLNQFDFLNPDAQAILKNGLNALDEQTFSGMISQFMPSLDAFLDACFMSLKNQIRNQIKIACISRNIKSPLMWAHYASNHKGFAIGYDFRGNEISQCSNCPKRSCSNIMNAAIYPVIYSDKRFDATQYGKWYIEQYIKRYFGIMTDSVFYDEFLLTKAALYKSNDWKYEDEWRIICSTPNQAIEQQECYSIKKKPLAIYFGSQIPDIYRKILTSIADEKGIAKYQMYVEDYSFEYELNYKQI